MPRAPNYRKRHRSDDLENLLIERVALIEWPQPRQLLIEVVLNDFHVRVVAECTVHRLNHRRRKIERDEFGIAPDSPH